MPLKDDNFCDISDFNNRYGEFSSTSLYVNHIEQIAQKNVQLVVGQDIIFNSEEDKIQQILTS